jgi:hypothetical protein
MSARIWVRHPDLDVVKQVAASSRPILARGGWQQLTDDEVAAHEADLQAARDARAAALAPASAPPAPAPQPDKAAKKSAPEKATAPAATPEKQES